MEIRQAYPEKFRAINARHLILHEMLCKHHPSCMDDGRQRRRASALVTTQTELIAIADPAMTGFSKPKAASGMPIRL